MLHWLLTGLIIGLSIAAPVGPIGILCINRTLHEGFKAGFIAGCGAATADGIYGLTAGFGLTFVTAFLLNHQAWVRTIGGIFLLYLGYKTITAKPSEHSAIVSPSRHLLRAYYTTLFLTVTNPLTIFSFVAIFAGLGIVNTSTSYLQAGLLVIGMVLGSLLWWVILCGAVSWLLRDRISPRILSWINRFSGAILLSFGVIALASLAYRS